MQKLKGLIAFVIVLVLFVGGWFIFLGLAYYAFSVLPSFLVYLGTGLGVGSTIVTLSEGKSGSNSQQRPRSDGIHG